MVIIGIKRIGNCFPASEVFTKYYRMEIKFGHIIIIMERICQDLIPQNGI